MYCLYPTLSRSLKMKRAFESDRSVKKKLIFNIYNPDFFNFAMAVFSHNFKALPRYQTSL